MTRLSCIWKQAVLIGMVSFSFIVAHATVIRKEMNEGWTFRRAWLPNWYPATVPGVVQTDLLANELIEDPFFRLNERDLQWIDKADWMYKTTFDVPRDMFEKDNIRIVFKGLDTYGNVYLNGGGILSANNMFREWKADIKPALKEKGNELEVYFHSPIKTDIPKFDALPFQYRTGPDQSEHGGIFEKRVSIFTRKAGYHYGWDWGPRFVTSGIWRPVYIEAWNDLRVEDIYFQQKEVNAKKAEISTHVEILADRDVSGAEITVRDNRNGKIYATAEADLKKGVNTVSVDFSINDPELWWCNGLGNPHLYTFQTDVTVGSKVLESHLTKVGIRSLKVINRKDEYGMTLFFELNGVPVFAKGANYIPQDSFLPRVTDEKYRQTILDAVNVNMNMLRVWGGGIYENDIFYDLCDEYGIMVWQDFMFACSLYPSEGEFLENIRQEAIDNVKRLRNHASIALWCGNNEAHEFWISWGWREHYAEKGEAIEKLVWKQYEDLFHKALPDVLAEYSPGMFYWRSSPYSNGSEDDKNGDRHYWGVWHGQHPTSNFNVIRSRFFSEYGFQSFPEFESIKLFAPKPSDWSVNSEVMLAHQRAGTHANELVRQYLEREYKTPKDFQALVYMGQVLQGDAIKTAIEAHRRDMPYCMGTLFWQHNDCWPVASWSSRDYYGRWKAQHYFTREAYRDVLISPIADETHLHFFVVSDRLKADKGTLHIKVITLDGSFVNEINQSVEIPENTSSQVFSIEKEKLCNGFPENAVVVLSTLCDGKGTVYKNRNFLVMHKDMDFPQVRFLTSVRPVSEGYEVTVTADKFARAVFLSIEGIDNFFSDNYFDLLPNEAKTIRVRTELSQSEFEKQLTVTSFDQAYIR